MCFYRTMMVMRTGADKEEVESAVVEIIYLFGNPPKQLSGEWNGRADKSPWSAGWMPAADTLALGRRGGVRWLCSCSLSLPSPPPPLPITTTTTTSSSSQQQHSQQLSPQLPCYLFYGGLCYEGTQLTPASQNMLQCP